MSAFLTPTLPAGTGRAHRPPPSRPPMVPPRRTVPAFAAIRLGGGGRLRLRFGRTARHRPGPHLTGLLVTGLLAAATALAAGPLRIGPPAPAAHCVSGR